MKRVELARGAVPLKRRTTLARKAMGTTRNRPVAASAATKTGDWSQDTRDRVSSRSQGVCEVCGCQPATDLHHRRPRRTRDHRIVNALAACRQCHSGAHQHPAEAREFGWIVHTATDPASVPLLVNGNRWVILQADGTYRTHADSYGEVA